jgi:hypothetical protein
MKIHRFFLALFVVAAAFAPPFARITNANTGTYGARLVSPTTGQVLVPGQQVKVAWKAMLPPVDLSWCELELYLSLDGGKSFPYRITPQLDPRASFFYWTVPNTPSSAAVLDIRFGCEGSYPESYSPQPASTFVIANVALPSS